MYTWSRRCTRVCDVRLPIRTYTFEETIRRRKVRIEEFKVSEDSRIGVSLTRVLDERVGDGLPLREFQAWLRRLLASNWTRKTDISVTLMMVLSVGGS